jgi:hypothetical protein
MAAPWDQIFLHYDRGDLSFRNAFIATGYRQIYSSRDELDDLSYFACFICAIDTTRSAAFRRLVEIGLKAKK